MTYYSVTCGWKGLKAHGDSIADTMSCPVTPWHQGSMQPTIHTTYPAFTRTNFLRANPVGHFSGCWDKILDKKINLRKERLIWVNSLRVQSIRAQKAWWQEFEASWSYCVCTQEGGGRGAAAGGSFILCVQSNAPACTPVMPAKSGVSYNLSYHNLQPLSQEYA